MGSGEKMKRGGREKWNKGRGAKKGIGNKKRRNKRKRIKRGKKKTEKEKEQHE